VLLPTDTIPEAQSLSADQSRADVKTSDSVSTQCICVLLLWQQQTTMGIDKIETALTSVQAALGLYLLIICERLQICAALQPHGGEVPTWVGLQNEAVSVVPAPATGWHSVTHAGHLLQHVPWSCNPAPQGFSQSRAALGPQPLQAGALHRL
jgi:hypothetical protein